MFVFHFSFLYFSSSYANNLVLLRSEHVDLYMLTECVFVSCCSACHGRVSVLSLFYFICYGRVYVLYV